MFPGADFQSYYVAGLVTVVAWCVAMIAAAVAAWCAAQRAYVRGKLARMERQIGALSALGHATRSYLLEQEHKMTTMIRWSVAVAALLALAATAGTAYGQPSAAAEAVYDPFARGAVVSRYWIAPTEIRAGDVCRDVCRSPWRFADATVDGSARCRVTGVPEAQWPRAELRCGAVLSSNATRAVIAWPMVPVVLEAGPRYIDTHELRWGPWSHRRDRWDCRAAWPHAGPSTSTALRWAAGDPTDTGLAPLRPPLLVAPAGWLPTPTDEGDLGATCDSSIWGPFLAAYNANGGGGGGDDGGGPPPAPSSCPAGWHKAPVPAAVLEGGREVPSGTFGAVGCCWQQFPRRYTAECKTGAPPPPPPDPISCGDGTCNGAETCSTCPVDCGACPPPPPPPPSCGDGVCAGDENTASCPVDCPAGGELCGAEVDELFRAAEELRRCVRAVPR